MPVHHNDCTWCIERYAHFVKEGKKTREIELCKLGNSVTPPGTMRYCPKYRQIGCEECESGDLAVEHMSYDLRVATVYGKLRPFEETAT